MGASRLNADTALLARALSRTMQSANRPAVDFNGALAAAEVRGDILAADDNRESRPAKLSNGWIVNFCAIEALFRRSHNAGQALSALRIQIHALRCSGTGNPSVIGDLCIQHGVGK